MMSSNARAGRARIVDLVVYDVALLLVVVGLLVAEKHLPTREELAARAAARAQPPQPPRPPEPGPAPAPVSDRAPVPATERAPAPATERTPAPTGDPARPQVEALVAEARRAFEAGDPDGALEVLARADGALRASPAWQQLAAPARARIEQELARDDRWRAVLADAQALSDAGQALALEALLARSGARSDALEAERVRSKGRAGKTAGQAGGGGFQIRGFVPDEARLEGRRCTVEGGVDRGHLEQVRDALDVLLALAAEELGAAAGDKLTLKVLAEDAAPEPPTATRVTTHARAREPAADLVARARLVVARAVVAAHAPRALPWAREALVRALAGTEPAGRADRPRFTPAGRAWRRLALGVAPTADRIAGALSAAEPDPALCFALGVAALWGGVDDGPLNRALDAARDGREHALTPDEARALAAVLPSLLESP